MVFVYYAQAGEVRVLGYTSFLQIFVVAVELRDLRLELVIQHHITHHKCMLMIIC